MWWWYAIQLLFILFIPVYLINSPGQLMMMEANLMPDFSSSSDSNNTLSLNTTDIMDPDEFPGNKSEICGVSSSKSCTDTPIARNNFMNETLDSDKLANKTDLIEIIVHSTQHKSRNSDSLISKLDTNLTDSNSFIASGNETFTLIKSPNVENNSSLSELISLWNMTQNDTSKSSNISKINSTNVIPKIAASKIVRGLDLELKTNLTDLDYLNQSDKSSEMKASVDEMFSIKNMENVVLVTDRSFVKSDFRKLLEIVRDATSALLQSFHITTRTDNVTFVDGNVTSVNDNITLVGSNVTLNNDDITLIGGNITLIGDDGSNNFSITDNENVCSKQWTYFNKTNSCYFVGHNSTSYDDALTICSVQDAFLTSIIDSDEMKFISELVGNETYLIGLFKNNNKWYWIDNYTKLNYTNWRIFEPNNCCGMNVKCVAVNWNGITDDHWDDIDCNDNLPTNFVCKKKL